jgi:hypothetical protein
LSNIPTTFTQLPAAHEFYALQIADPSEGREFALDQIVLCCRLIRLRELTRTVIDRIETVSGCPVLVSEDPSVKTLVASRIARGANRIQGE